MLVIPAPNKLRWDGAHAHAVKPLEENKFMCICCNLDFHRFSCMADLDQDGKFCKSQDPYLSKDWKKQVA